MSNAKLMCGWEFLEARDVDDVMDVISQGGVSFGCAGICAPERQKKVMQSIAHKQPVPALTRADMQIVASGMRWSWLLALLMRGVGEREEVVKGKV